MVLAVAIRAISALRRRAWRGGSRNCRSRIVHCSPTLIHMNASPDKRRRPSSDVRCWSLFCLRDVGANDNTPYPSDIAELNRAIRKSAAIQDALS